jgi:2-keto-4-pentenoate hydratase/2-oxohepta-3-ene-1,7-dioic acid hydratase in catechol pathway
MIAIGRHSELHGWQSTCLGRVPDGLVSEVTLGPPVPNPRQVFGIGLNYRDHAEETGKEAPPAPLTFTKFPSAIAGPCDDIELSGPSVDWEVELVVVVGQRCHRVPVENSWDVVAGLTVGQDISDRAVQYTGSPPQFCLGKSFAGYGPIGPALVSTDTLADRDDIELWCDVSGERMQHSRTSQLIFSVPVLIAYLSSIVPLGPGDLIFTGTPSGVGVVRGRMLNPDDVIVSGAEGIGELRNFCRTGLGPFEI